MNRKIQKIRNNLNFIIRIILIAFALFFVKHSVQAVIEWTNIIPVHPKTYIWREFEQVQYFERYTKREKALLRFIKDEIGVDGIRLFKIKNNGTIKEKKLNEIGNVNSETC